MATEFDIAQQPHFVAPVDETPLRDVDQLDESAPSASFWREVWHKLRRQPLFIVSSIIIALIVIVAIFPGWFAHYNPAITTNTNNCLLANAFGGTKTGHLLGFDNQGCDLWSLVIYGARPSVLVGIFTTISVFIIGGGLGALAGYYGRWLDSLLSRIADIFFAIPLVLGAIVLLQAFSGKGVGVQGVVLVLATFSWPQLFRITRGAVLQVKQNDFITASKALGVSRVRILSRHVVPNSLSPMIVWATVSLGGFIVTEATLSFLGLGLPLSEHSWGSQVSAYQTYLQQDPMLLFYPSIALAITVLAFMMLGDTVGDALDPKTRG